MEFPKLPKRMISDPVVGAKVAFTRTLTEADVALFIGVTWDVNPLHTNDEYVESLPIKRRIVPGLLTASLLTHLGGLWAFMATEMHFEFLAPVYINDTIRAEAEVKDVDSRKGLVVLQCRCLNREGIVVLRGKVLGYPGRFTD